MNTTLITVGVYRLSTALQLLMTLSVALHMAGGFPLNTYYTYVLDRFSSNAGIVSGITGGGTYIITSLLSQSVVSVIAVDDPISLSAAYLTSAVLIAGASTLFLIERRRVETGDPIHAVLDERAELIFNKHIINKI